MEEEGDDSKVRCHHGVLLAKNVEDEAPRVEELVLGSLDRP